MRPARGMGDPAGGGDRLARLVEAFEADCAVCGGTGMTPNERWLVWHRRAGELVAVAQAARRAHELRPAPASAPAPAPMQDAEGESAIVTAVERAIDDHMRARPSGPEEDTCEACQGIGKELTPAGRLFTEMLVRHGFVRRR